MSNTGWGKAIKLYDGGPVPYRHNDRALSLPHGGYYHGGGFYDWSVHYDFGGYHLSQPDQIPGTTAPLVAPWGEFCSLQGQQSTGGARCVVYCFVNQTANVARFQHGDNPEASREFAFSELRAVRSLHDSPVQAWLDAVHEYERTGR